MQVTTRTGRNTFVTVDAVSYALGALVVFVVVATVVAGLIGFVFCWPVILLTWLFPGNLLMAVTGWTLTAMWCALLLAGAAYTGYAVRTERREQQRRAERRALARSGRTGPPTPPPQAEPEARSAT